MAPNTQETVTVPAGADALAQGVKKLLVAVVENHKAAAGQPLTEVSADVTAAVVDLGPALSQVGLLADEVKTDGLGVGEALLIGGLEAAKTLTKSPSAAQG